MPQKGVIETVVSVAEVVCGLFEVDGVPEHDGCGEEIESAGAVALLFKPRSRISPSRLKNTALASALRASRRQ